MTTYNTYQEAKIENPECEIYWYLDGGLNDSFTTLELRDFDIKNNKCNPADHCMTVEKFLKDNCKFDDGDTYLDWKGRVRIVGKVGFAKDACNDIRNIVNADQAFILRAAALEKIPTETPEEKEVLDGIESAGEVEWDGESLPPVGVECEALFIDHEHKGYGEFLVLGYHSNYVWVEYIGKLRNKSKHYTAKINMVKFRKPETPQQREDRERLENGKSLHTAASKTEEAIAHGIFRLWEMEEKETRNHYCQLAEIIGYKKEKTHGTN